MGGRLGSRLAQLVQHGGCGGASIPADHGRDEVVGQSDAVELPGVIDHIRIERCIEIWSLIAVELGEILGRLGCLAHVPSLQLGPPLAIREHWWHGICVPGGIDIDILTGQPRIVDINLRLAVGGSRLSRMLVHWCLVGYISESSHCCVLSSNLI